MPVRGSNLVEEAEKRKENILQKIKAVNVKPDISYENNFENQDENSYQENEEEIRKNSIKVQLRAKQTAPLVINIKKMRSL